MYQSTISFCDEEDGEKIRIWQTGDDGEIEDEILMTREVAIQVAEEILEMLVYDDN